MPYLLDANTFIEAKDSYYGFDFCPCYWDWLLRANETGQVFSIERVFDELTPRTEHNDDVSRWATERGKGFFLPLDVPTSVELGKVVNYVQFLPHPVSDTNKRTFLAKADPILIACAIAYGYTVVTREVAVAANSHAIKIPNICKYFNVPTATPFQMLRHLGARFVLAPQPDKKK